MYKHEEDTRRKKNIFQPNEFLNLHFFSRAYLSTYFSLCIICVTITQRWSDSQRETGVLRIEFTIEERELSLNKLVDVIETFQEYSTAMRVSRIMQSKRARYEMYKNTQKYTEYIKIHKICYTTLYIVKYYTKYTKKIIKL